MAAKPESLKVKGRHLLPKRAGIRKRYKTSANRAAREAWRQWRANFKKDPEYPIPTGVKRYTRGWAD